MRPALTALACASIEWYDFFLYATAAALVFPALFFSSELPPLVAQIASFSTFAVGFIARPVGAVLFGHLGDRAGRKVALASSLGTMGIASTLIGCLPPYSIAGFYSPLCLVLLRLAQGLAVGGQWSGAALMAFENAPAARRGLHGSIAQAGVPVGVVTANLAFLLVTLLCSPQGFFAYGWRILFVLSIGFVGLSLFIQLRLQDTAAFRELTGQRAEPPRSKPSPVIQALRNHPRSILLAAGAFIATNLTFYILIAYTVSYGTGTSGLHLPRSIMLGAVLISNILAMPVLFLSGALSDRYGRRRVFMVGLLLMSTWAFALFPLLDTRNPIWITVGLAIAMSAQGITYGPLAALFAELFPTAVRYSAASMAYQLGAIAGGGVAPIIAATLYARTHDNIWISTYIACACGVSLVCLGKLRDSHRLALHQAGEAVT
ncbi:MAG TPA: MFS transporter [Steroidobacteraceae bacterium]|nr:MFS transporter [Steroidobacteraceae bacterium]